MWAKKTGLEDVLRIDLSGLNDDKPGWPLQNPPPVATSKSPTPVVVVTGVPLPKEGEIVSDRTGIIYSFFFPKASFSAASFSL
jgi:hypothetical protein